MSLNSLTPKMRLTRLTFLYNSKGICKYMIYKDKLEGVKEYRVSEAVLDAVLELCKNVRRVRRSEENDGTK